MKKLGRLLIDHLRSDFHFRYYFSVLLFIILGLTVNYAIDLEDSIIDKPKNNPWRMMWYFLLYSFAYYTVVALLYYFKRVSFVLTRKFWIVSFTGLICLSVNTGFPFLYRLIHLSIDNYRISGWAYLVVSNLTSFLFITLPVFIIVRSYIGRPSVHLGISTKADITPYLKILAIITPLIALAAFEKGLGSYYPTYKTNQVAALLHLPSWLPVAIYESAYALDFFNVELFFRGFLVIALSNIMGKDAILPMVATYCFLHFGKPVGEAVSSIFGGYILGVIALYTRNIWGGVLLHIGVAGSMELAAWVFKP